MDLKTMKRSRDKVAASLHVDSKGQCMVKKTIHIVFPERFLFINLANTKGGFNVVGYFMIVDEQGNYSVYNLPSKLRLDPDSVDIVLINGIRHMRLTMGPGNTILRSNETIEEKKLVYYIYKELVENGKAPEYFNGDDLLTCLTKVSKYNGVKLYRNINILHMMISILMRQKDDLNKHWRNLITEPELAMIPMGDPTYGSKGGIARMTSGHFSDNLTGALLEENTEITDLERILRTA